MKNVIAKMKKINELHAQARNLQKDLLDPIEKVAPGAIQVRIGIYGQVSLLDVGDNRLLDICHKAFFSEEEIRTFIEVIAETIGEQDFPVPQRYLKDLFTEYDCNEEERKLLLSKASSDEAYDAWVEEERRMMLD